MSVFFRLPLCSLCSPLIVACPRPQEKAREKLEGKSVSFLKLLADVLGLPHGESSKKATLVSALVAFLSCPKKAPSKVESLAEKAEALRSTKRKSSKPDGEKACLLIALALYKRA